MAWIRCMGGSTAKMVGTDKVPYLLRATPFDANLKKMKLVGGSVAFNQLVNIPSSSMSKTVNNVTIVDNRDGTLTISTTADGASDDTFPNAENCYITENHVYLYMGTPKNGGLNTFRSYVAGAAYITSGTDVGNGVIYKGIKTGYANLYRYRISPGAVITTPIVFKNIFIDITQMFGSTIADYIYSLEQGTAGAGVAFFRNLFPEDYYAYNAGELLSVKPTAHDVVGKNLLDMSLVKDQVSWNLFEIQGLPNTSYICSNNISVAKSTDELPFYAFNSSGNPSSSTIVNSEHSVSITTNADGKIKIQQRRITGSDSFQNYQIQIEFGTATTYEPYKKYTYPLDGTRKVYRKYGIVDLGSLNYVYSSNMFTNSDMRSIIKPATSNANPINGVSDLYTITSYNGLAEMCLAVSSVGNIFIKNSTYTDPAVFKTAMNGVYLIYELATPFYETVSNPELRGLFKLDSNNKLYCDGDTCEDIVSPMAMMSGGTEAFVDSRAVPVPVGHESTYYSVDFPE